MSNMTPFEIRLELLKMARDMLYDEYNGKGEDPPEHPGLPSIPSEADIITKAQTLNGFVSNISAPETPKVTIKKTS